MAPNGAGPTYNARTSNTSDWLVLHDAREVKTESVGNLYEGSTTEDST